MAITEDHDELFDRVRGNLGEHFSNYMFIVMDDDGDLFYDYSNFRVGRMLIKETHEDMEGRTDMIDADLGFRAGRRRRRMTQVQVPAQGWEPRDYQLPLLKYMTQDKKGLRAVVAWHRRAGKDLTCVNIVAIKALQRVGTYWYVLPYGNQARRIVWNGMTGEGKKFIDYFPKELVERKSEQEMRIHLKNGSVIQLMGSDDPDKMVGANPVGVVFSEYSISDPSAWQLINPILAENGGWALFNGTPRGENHFYKILLKLKLMGCGIVATCQSRIRKLYHLTIFAKLEMN